MVIKKITESDCTYHRRKEKMKEQENKKLEEMLNSMDDTELLIMYHESLRALVKRGINPLEEK